MSVVDEERSLVDLVESQRFDKAIQRGDALLQADPNNLTAHFQLGLAHFKSGNPATALAHGKRVLEINPPEENGNVNVGVYHRALGMLNEARACFEKELTLRPFALEARHNLGMLFFQQRQYGEAAAHLNACFERGYLMDEIVEDLSTCHHQLRDLENEIRVYTQFLERNPFSIWALGNAGSALLDQGNVKKATLLLMKANRLDPSDDKIAANLERARRSYGKMRGAKHCATA